MNIVFFIAKRLTFKRSRSFTRLIVRIAIAGISISLAVMIMAVAIVTGFRNEVKQKLVGFSGHMTVKNLDLNYSKDSKLIRYDSLEYNQIKNVPGVLSISSFTGKAGILKSDNEIEGLYFKGVSPDYDWNFINKHLVEGELPKLKKEEDTYELVMSAVASNRTQVKLNDFVEVFFIKDQLVRRRKMKVVGIYSTGLDEFDKSNVYTDQRVIQRIYENNYDWIGGYEVRINDMNQLVAFQETIEDITPFSHQVVTIEDQFPIILQWLELIDTNVVVIVGLMSIVALFNMLTALFILMVERTRMIGVLKSIGASNGQILKLFFTKSIYLTVVGLIFGNVIALGLGYGQQYFKWIQLDPATYFMSEVPFQFEWSELLLMNLLTLFICVGSVVFISRSLSKIDPVKTIKYQ
jgi:lipoprotein-releasing system permease protein